MTVSVARNHRPVEPLVRALAGEGPRPSPGPTVAQAQRRRTHGSGSLKLTAQRHPSMASLPDLGLLYADFSFHFLEAILGVADDGEAVVPVKIDEPLLIHFRPD